MLCMRVIAELAVHVALENASTHFAIALLWCFFVFPRFVKERRGILVFMGRLWRRGKARLESVLA